MLIVLEKRCKCKTWSGTLVLSLENPSSKKNRLTKTYIKKFDLWKWANLYPSLKLTSWSFKYPFLPLAQRYHLLKKFRHKDFDPQVSTLMAFGVLEKMIQRDGEVILKYQVAWKLCWEAPCWLQKSWFKIWFKTLQLLSLPWHAADGVSDRDVAVHGHHRSRRCRDGSRWTSTFFMRVFFRKLSPRIKAGWGHNACQQVFLDLLGKGCL